MHVFEFFNPLLETPHVEVEESPLPETRQQAFLTGQGQFQLSRRNPLPPPQAARDALLQYLHHCRWRSPGRFANQQMDVLGHDHISHQRHAAAIAHLVENPNKGILRPGRTQQRQSPVTTERDEVQISTAVPPNQILGHKEGKSSDPSKCGKGRAPVKATPVTPRRLARVVSLNRECSSRGKTRKGLPPALQNSPVVQSGVLDQDINFVKGKCKSLCTAK